MNGDGARSEHGPTEDGAGGNVHGARSERNAWKRQADTRRAVRLAALGERGAPEALSVPNPKCEEARIAAGPQKL